DANQTVLDAIEVGEREAWADHQYLDDDPTGTPSDVYVVTVTVTDDDTGSGVGAATVTVNNVDPVVSIDSIVDENGAVIGTDVDIAIIATQVTLEGSFTDTGTLDTHTASIDWGDGIVDNLGTVVGSLSVTHIYWAPCECTITLTVTDDDTGVGSATREITVVDASGAIANVIDRLLPSGDDPNVAAAINSLRGDDGGLDANGALDMLEKDNLVAALRKIGQALQYLEAAEAAELALDLTHEKGLLALAAKSVAVIAVREAEAVASSPKDFLKWLTATVLIAQGDGLRLAPDFDFVGAVGKYLEAVRQVQGIR
nr:hypothetical protein [Gemmatimonadota bacterium]